MVTPMNDCNHYYRLSLLLTLNVNLLGYALCPSKYLIIVTECT